MRTCINYSIKISYIEFYYTFIYKKSIIRGHAKSVSIYFNNKITLNNIRNKNLYSPWLIDALHRHLPLVLCICYVTFSK